MRKLIIALIIAIIIILVLLAVYVAWSKNNAEEKYCSQFSYDNCPLDRCKVGGSCPVCENIGCHPKDYDKDWPKE